MQPLVISTGPYNHPVEKFAMLGHGSVSVSLENATSGLTRLWVVRMSNERMAQLPRPVQLRPFLMGKRLLTNSTFRNLFRSETVGEEEGIGIKNITFLFTDLKGSTALYEEIGDPKAYHLVRQHFHILNDAIARHSGAVVKTIGDAVMAVFMTPEDAVRAASEMIEAVQQFNATIDQDIHIKIGIHTGHSIVVSLNDRLDYFGQTVNIAARVQGLADANEICITEETFAASGVSDQMAGYRIEPAQVIVKGMADNLQIYKIKLPVRLQ